MWYIFRFFWLKIEGIKRKKVIVIKEYRYQFSGPKILPQSNQNYSAEIAPTET